MSNSSDWVANRIEQDREFLESLGLEPSGISLGIEAMRSLLQGFSFAACVGELPYLGSTVWHYEGLPCSCDFSVPGWTVKVKFQGNLQE